MCNEKKRKKKKDPPNEELTVPLGDFSFLLTRALKVGYSCPTNPTLSVSHETWTIFNHLAACFIRERESTRERGACSSLFSPLSLSKDQRTKLGQMPITLSVISDDHFYDWSAAACILLRGCLKYSHVLHTYNGSQIRTKQVRSEVCRWRPL